MDPSRVAGALGIIQRKNISVGVHISPLRFKEEITRGGLVQGNDKKIDRGPNPPGVYFTLINPEQVGYFIGSGRLGGLVQKTRATFANLLNIAMRRGDQQFTVYLFDGEEAMRLNPEHEEKRRRHVFREIRLAHSETQAPWVPGDMLFSIDYGKTERLLVAQRAMELKKTMRTPAGKIGPKHLGSYARFERVDFVMRAALQAIESGCVPKVPKVG